MLRARVSLLSQQGADDVERDQDRDLRREDQDEDRERGDQEERNELDLPPPAKGRLRRALSGAIDALANQSPVDPGRLAELAPGSRVAVRVDPQNRNRVVIDWRGLARAVASADDLRR